MVKFKKSKYYIGGVEGNQLDRLVEHLIEQDKEFGTLLEVCYAVIKKYKKIKIGADIKILRLLCGMTQTQLANRINTSQEYISQLETSKKSIGKTFRKKVSNKIYGELLRELKSK